MLAALRKVIEQEGVFCALYSDRASHFFWTPRAGWRSIWNDRRKRRCLLDLKPDISCALKSGHFNLLRTPPSPPAFRLKNISRPVKLTFLHREIKLPPRSHDITDAI